MELDLGNKAKSIINPAFSYKKFRVILHKLPKLITNGYKCE